MCPLALQSIQNDTQKVDKITDHYIRSTPSILHPGRVTTKQSHLHLTQAEAYSKQFSSNQEVFGLVNPCISPWSFY